MPKFTCGSPLSRSTVPASKNLFVGDLVHSSRKLGGYAMWTPMRLFKCSITLSCLRPPRLELYRVCSQQLPLTPALECYFRVSIAALRGCVETCDISTKSTLKTRQLYPEPRTCKLRNQRALPLAPAYSQYCMNAGPWWILPYT